MRRGPRRRRIIPRISDAKCLASRGISGLIDRSLTSIGGSNPFEYLIPINNPSKTSNPYLWGKSIDCKAI